MTLGKSELAVATFGVGLGVGVLLHKLASGPPTTKPVQGTSEVLRLIRPNVLRLTPYRCARDDYDQGILLDANENSLGPPLAAEHELAGAGLERYPCPYQRELKTTIAHFRNGAHGTLTPANLFLGVGSDEVIDLMIRIACSPREDAILITPPTYGMYSVCANIHDVDIISVPLVRTATTPLPSFHIDPSAILRAVTPQTKIIFLCSPGNPTANCLRLADIKAVLEAKSYKGFVFVDEAYVDFAEQPSLSTLVTSYPRLVVAQTLSKGFGLAGIRLGIAFGDPELIQILNNVKAPYNINKLTAKVAADALANVGLLHDKVQLILEEKAKVIAALQALPFVHQVYASDANFVLFQCDNAFAVYKEMAEAGVVIRYRGNQLLLDSCLRATIGSPSENDRMLELFASVSRRLA
ncbi:histidinol-phosphate aminotransferase [Saprolegnia parasitica CBS 223.65]|uniref:histidinol-phosphate transaminase n=1 Tax=Saprolegnia parasitica (strain CBS 223.65) TaxID=695850 RepID=A0A067BNG6_SAPPC|nr:histidinol-phosphate aminotransferase [Saprolegnia parasitica CBS 223.65]KDO19773.1 histidinol-phosphate aminotransferase [Saprolegnia parasitica CBS 223.65]|eukprot:XP_012209534.1 histidinol-phosphate aminotransferase [Saprolegnia parasitica CBS 223.65]